MTIRAVVAELFHADGRTDGQADEHDEANSRFLTILPTFLKKTTKTTETQRIIRSSEM